jgi:antitoxin component YwqK of YwqJK toxin-antitoxin module
MIRSLLVIFILAIAGHMHAQENLIPFLFTSEDDNRLIKETDSLKYYVASGDSANTVVINEDALWYKLLNKEHKTVAEGAFITEGDKYLQDGKWIEKYDNGKVRLVGYYHKNKPIGTWEEYYTSGKIKTVSNYGMFLYKGEQLSCLSGSYQEYYPNGKLKVNGFYSGSAVSYKDSLTVDDPVSGKTMEKVVAHSELRAEKVSHWEYYTETGELDRKDDF